MGTALPTIVAFILTVSFGVAEGWWSGRWKRSEGLDRAAARCVDVPRTIGEWEGADEELDARQLSLAKINGYIWRRYVHRLSGDAITVMLVCGRPGPIAVHTPDVCFQGGGMEMKTSPQRFRLDVPDPAGAAEFWATRFEKAGSGYMVRWSWTTDGSWKAADSPRIQFARAPALYKLYVIHPSTKPDQKPDDDSELDSFLRALLPAMQTGLFPSPRD
jgi:Protein of unknown function (DUF3485)